MIIEANEYLLASVDGNDNDNKQPSGENTEKYDCDEKENLQGNQKNN